MLTKYANLIIWHAFAEYSQQSAATLPLTTGSGTKRRNRKRRNKKRRNKKRRKQKTQKTKNVDWGQNVETKNVEK